MSRLAGLILLLGCLLRQPSLAEPMAVDILNLSRPTRCAEEDNVDIRLQHSRVTQFEIVAEHPPYIGLIRQDSTAPDFSHCDMSKDPSFPFTPASMVLYEDDRIRLVGHRYASFWRPEQADFAVGDRVETGLHLVQLIRRRPHSEVEVLVVYPADGYWRVKPLPPASLPDTAYGSSFLIGPISEDGRPFVAIRRLDFDPQSLRFAIQFRDGTRGALRVEEASSERTRLSVRLEQAVPAPRAFAALRSMFVNPRQADVSAAWWPAEQTQFRQAAIMAFDRITTGAVRFGRVEPSNHNLSAPDLVFQGFQNPPGP